MTPFDLPSAADRVRSTLLSKAGQVIPESDLLTLMPALNRSKATMQLKEAIRHLRSDGEPIRHIGSAYVYLLSPEVEPAPVFAADFVSTLGERRSVQGDLFGAVP